MFDFFANLFKKDANSNRIKKAPKIKKPPKFASSLGDDKKMGKGYNYHIDDKDAVVENDDSYDYALDPNDEYNFDRDGSGVGEDDEEDDEFFGDDDDDDD
ncbi:MAG: hypothetical protein BWY78_01379 [Alphaproteobacteria bacterium ADurb.Bin438]|nr:MAG: hypothetical protein BWY78_01379 [Alphaproteobacteria bacterium ADurb.Bin438]